jgi:hypothetical protein
VQDAENEIEDLVLVAGQQLNKLVFSTQALRRSWIPILHGQSLWKKNAILILKSTAFLCSDEQLRPHRRDWTAPGGTPSSDTIL